MTINLNPLKDQYFTTLAQIAQMQKLQIDLEKLLIANAPNPPEFEINEEVEKVNGYPVPTYIVGIRGLVDHETAEVTYQYAYSYGKLTAPLATGSRILHRSETTDGTWHHASYFMKLTGESDA